METVSHPGIVSAVNNETVTITIESRSACAGCNLKNSCNLAECLKKEIAVATPLASSYRIGDKVSVSIDSRFGFAAAFYAYIFPLLLMLITVALGEGLGWSEISTGISAIIILIPYYLGLFLTQKYFQTRFKYIISKVSE